VTLVENPGGGTIATAQMPQQHTVQGAMGKVLQQGSQEIAGAHAGEVIAVGPGNATLHYDWQFTAINSGTAAGRKMLGDGRRDYIQICTH
jgi:hypothetical protein